MENSYIQCSYQGVSMRGTLLRLQPCNVGFEVYQPGLVLRVSELLEEFRAVIADEEAYSGRAVVTSLVNLGQKSVVEVKLDDPGVKLGQGGKTAGPEQFCERYSHWFEAWQQHELISTDLKMTVLSLHSYLWELKLLCEQFEVSVLAHPTVPAADMERALLLRLSEPVIQTLDLMRERFLAATESTPPGMRSVHQLFVTRHLHPLFLCAPFGYRTYQKPLGYAGDYEMMNQIHRNTFEGGSIFARLVHYWLVNQPPAKSVRARVDYLKRKLGEEAVRTSLEKRPLKILNLGCGPAREVEQFIMEHPLGDKAEITLLDSDAETLEHVEGVIHRARQASGRSPKVVTRQVSVAQLIREAGRTGHALGAVYDLIYCGGLFDYLSPRVCKQLVSVFYHHVAPGGLVVAANMYDRFRRFSAMLEYLLDWHLVYRSADDLLEFIPEDVPHAATCVSDDGINLFLELRKPCS